MTQVIAICQAVSAHKGRVGLAVELDLLLGMPLTKHLVRSKFLALNRFQQIEDAIVFAEEVRVGEIDVGIIEWALSYDVG